MQYMYIESAILYQSAENNFITLELGHAVNKNYIINYYEVTSPEIFKEYQIH